MKTDLGYLARLTLFAGLFFASTAVIPGGDGGAGDAGDAGGGGDAGDGGDDAGGDDGAEGGGSGEGEIGDDEAGDGGDADQPDDGDAGELEGDTKPSPKAESEAIKKALEKLRESDPESAKVLRKQFFNQEQALNGYRESFKTPAEAVAMAQETMGPYKMKADWKNLRVAIPRKVIQATLREFQRNLKREMAIIPTGDLPPQPGRKRSRKPLKRSARQTPKQRRCSARNSSAKSRTSAATANRSRLRQKR